MIKIKVKVFGCSDTDRVLKQEKYFEDILCRKLLFCKSIFKLFVQNSCNLLRNYTGAAVHRFKNLKIISNF